jgi:hypothetical protein
MLPALNRPLGFKDELTLFPGRSPSDSWCISHTFSDSIILISHNDTEAAALALLVYAWRARQLLLAAGLAVRGAVTHGSMYVDMEHSLFLGKALTDAYGLEQIQDWIGVAIDPSVSQRFPDLLETDIPTPRLGKCLFPRYDVPIKGGTVRSMHTLNWRWNLVAEVGTKKLFNDAGEESAISKIGRGLAYALEMRTSDRAYPARD